MKNPLYIGLLLMFIGCCGLCAFIWSMDSSDQQAGTEQSALVANPSESKTTDLLYFHGKKRCITCNAIETLSQEVIEQLNSEKISYHIIDISTEEGAKSAEKYEVTWSSLILNDKGRVNNLTKMGFS